MPDPFSIGTWRNLFSKHGEKFGWGLAVLFGVPLVIGFGWNQFGGGRNNAGSGRADDNTVVATVNGDSITYAQFNNLVGQMQGGETGQQIAGGKGQAAVELVQSVVIQQLAKSNGVSASDADIDKQIAQYRAQVSTKMNGGKKLTDEQWQEFLQKQNRSESDLRTLLASDPQLLGSAVANKLKADIPVSDQDVKNQTAEVSLDVLIVPTQAAMPSSMGMPPNPKALPDAQAKAKAEDLLAKAKGGTDFAILAKANSDDATAKKGGATGWLPEYKTSSPMSMVLGATGYGKDFDDVVHKTAKGQFTDVLKVKYNQGYIPGQGYGFARLLDRRNNPPKDFDPKKVTDELKQKGAQEKWQTLSQDSIKKADVKCSDPEFQAYYDYGKLTRLQQQQAMVGLGMAPPDTPAPDELKKQIDTQQAQVTKDFETLLKRKPDDGVAAAVVADAVQKQRNSLNNTPQQRTQLRDELISLDETILKTSEVRDVRLQLAGLYHEKGQDDLAKKQYDTIARLLDASPSYDKTSMQEESSVRQQLAPLYRTIKQPQDADKQQQKYMKLQVQIAEETLKEQEEARRQEEAQKAFQVQQKSGKGNAPGGGAPVPSGSINLGGPSGSAPPLPGNVGGDTGVPPIAPKP